MMEKPARWRGPQEGHALHRQRPSSRRQTLRTQPPTPAPGTPRSSTQHLCRIRSSENQGLTNTHAGCLLDPGPSGRGYESQAQGLGAGEPESERPGWMLALPCTGCVVSACLLTSPSPQYSSVKSGRMTVPPFMSPGTENIGEGLILVHNQ